MTTGRVAISPGRYAILGAISINDPDVFAPAPVSNNVTIKSLQLVTGKYLFQISDKSTIATGFFAATGSYLYRISDQVAITTPTPVPTTTGKTISLAGAIYRIIGASSISDPDVFGTAKVLSASGGIYALKGIVQFERIKMLSNTGIYKSTGNIRNKKTIVFSLH